MYKIFNKLVFIILTFLVFNGSHAQSFNGKTYWSDKVDISSYVSTSVKSIEVASGQKVTKNDVLIIMDDSRLKLDYSIAQSNLAALEPSKEESEMDLNRAFELYDRTLIPDVTLKTAEFKFSQAKAKYDAALAKLEKAQFLLDQVMIKSPINGRVLSINSSVGFYSDREKAKSLMTLVDDSKMHAIAYLKVSQWDQTLVGKDAIVSINKRNHKGKVISIGLMPLDNSKGISVYPVVVEFQVNHLMPEGMPLTINIK